MKIKLINLVLGVISGKLCVPNWASEIYLYQPKVQESEEKYILELEN